MDGHYALLIDGRFPMVGQAGRALRARTVESAQLTNQFQFFKDRASSGFFLGDIIRCGAREGGTTAQRWAEGAMLGPPG